MAHVVHASREVAVVRAPSMPIHPVHAVFLAGVIPLFAGALLSDIAYFRTYEIQWQNFASWLLAGGLVMAGVALVFAFAGLARPGARRPGCCTWWCWRSRGSSDSSTPCTTPAMPGPACPPAW